MSVLRTEAVQSEVKLKNGWQKDRKLHFQLLCLWLSCVPKIWTPVIEECLVCRREPQNVEDKDAVAVVKDGFLVGHVPKCFSLWMSMFLWLPKSSFNCKRTGNRVNREAGNGLEIACEYSVNNKNFLWKASLILTLEEDLRNVKQWTAESIKHLLYCITVPISSDRKHQNYTLLQSE